MDLAGSNDYVVYLTLNVAVANASLLRLAARPSARNATVRATPFATARAMQRLGAVSSAVVQSEPAAAGTEMTERLLVNGIIHQPPPLSPAEWLLLRGAAIVEVGTGAPPPSVAETTQVVDLKGKFVMPGLHDAHIHTYSVGEAMFFVDLSGCGNNYLRFAAVSH